MEFYLEGFGRLSHCARAPNSVSAYALHLHFSDVWPYMLGPGLLWTSAEGAGLPQTGQYRLRSDPDEQQACSRLCHELFGRHPVENSGKVVTEKFVPWVALMFEEATKRVAVVSGSPSGSCSAPVERMEAGPRSSSVAADLPELITISDDEASRDGDSDGVGDAGSYLLPFQKGWCAGVQEAL